MKKILQRSPSLKVLFLSYAALFILLVVVRNYEFWDLRKTTSKIIEIVSKSAQRQSTQTAISKAGTNEQIAVLELLPHPDYLGKQGVSAQLILDIQSDDSDLVEYQKLISGQEEQALFNKLLLLRKGYIESSKKVILLIKDGKKDEAINIYYNILSGLYNDYKKANALLINFVRNRDNRELKDAENHLSNINNSNKWINAALIIVLTFLGFLLIKMIKIIRSTNLELKKSERKYRTLTEKTNEIIQKCDENGNFIFSNDSFKKTLGYSEVELSKLTVSDILADESLNLNKPLPEFAEVITKAQQIFISRSGKKIYMEGTVLLEYINGKFAGSMSFFNDVTEKKQLEESLIASELKFRNFFNLAPIPMYAFDPDTYKFVLVNKAAADHYGFSEEETLNMTILDVTHEEEIIKVKGQILKIKEEIINTTESKIYKSNFSHFKKSGEMIDVEIYATPIIINDKKSILTISIDVTEQNQYENKITRAIIKTQEDERYEIGSELHDNVCQILAAAKMSLSMLKPSLTPSVTDLYNQSCRSILLATEEIRNLSHRLAPAFFDKIKLDEAFESLLKNFNIEDKYYISIYFDNIAKNYPINKEIQLNLYRILQEQLRNIIKYAKATTISIDVLIYNGRLKMRIADNGIGFDVNQVMKGIGLANMRRRAELFSGKLHINSSPDNGCEILITIPLHEMN